MAFLGDFGAALKELDPTAEKDTFGFFGETFEIVEDVPAMLMLKIAATMAGEVPEADGMVVMWKTWRIALGDEAFSKFEDLAVAKKANLQSLMELVMSLYQASSGRPTEQVPDSENGQSPTLPSSSTSASTPQDSGEDRDPSIPHLVPVSQVLAG